MQGLDGYAAPDHLVGGHQDGEMVRCVTLAENVRAETILLENNTDLYCRM